jgi:metal-responsive CopG/Arc/MetJ family transcriptional regulator
MKKELKNRERFSSTLRTELVGKLDDLHKRTSITKTKLLDQAVDLLLKKYESK